MLLKAASSGDDMLIFEDPSIQNDPKRSFHKPSTKFPRPDESPDLDMSGGPQKSEETRQWRNTRETTQHFMLKNKVAGSTTKLQSMKESGGDNGGAIKNKSVKNFTPNHLLNFSKQMRKNG